MDYSRNILVEQKSKEVDCIEISTTNPESEFKFTVFRIIKLKTNNLMSFLVEKTGQKPIIIEGYVVIDHILGHLEMPGEQTALLDKFLGFKKIREKLDPRNSGQ